MCFQESNLKPSTYIRKEEKPNYTIFGNLLSKILTGGDSVLFTHRIRMFMHIHLYPSYVSCVFTTKSDMLVSYITNTSYIRIKTMYITNAYGFNIFWG